MRAEYNNHTIEAKQEGGLYHAWIDGELKPEIKSSPYKLVVIRKSVALLREEEREQEIQNRKEIQTL